MKLFAIRLFAEYKYQNFTIPKSLELFYLPFERLIEKRSMPSKYIFYVPSFLRVIVDFGLALVLFLTANICQKKNQFFRNIQIRSVH